MRSFTTSISIKIDPITALKAFVNQKMLAEWWHVERSIIEAQDNGLYTLTWGVSEKGFNYISTGLIKKFRRGQELFIDHMVYLNPEKPFLGPMSLHVLVESMGDHTKLQITQGGYQEGEIWDWYYQAVCEAWPMVLENLKSYLEALSLEESL